MFPFLENNQVFSELMIAAVSIFLGIPAIFYSVKKIIKDKQLDAQFSIYIHFLIFFKRLKMLFNEFPDILQLFFDERTRQEVFKVQMPEDRANFACPLFRELCNNIIEYLSEVDNIIPPYKKNSNEWKEWYKDLLSIITFFHNGKMINKIYLYTSKNKYDEYKKEIASALESIGKIEESIYEKLKLRGVQSTELDEKLNLPELKDKLDPQY